MKDFDAPNLFFRVGLLMGCSNLVSLSKSLDQNFANKALAQREKSSHGRPLTNNI